MTDGPPDPAHPLVWTVDAVLRPEECIRLIARVEMLGFQTVTREIAVGDDAANLTSELTLLPFEEIRKVATIGQPIAPNAPAAPDALLAPDAPLAPTRCYTSS